MNAHIKVKIKAKTTEEPNSIDKLLLSRKIGEAAINAAIKTVTEEYGEEFVPAAMAGIFRILEKAREAEPDPSEVIVKLLQTITAN